VCVLGLHGVATHVARQPLGLAHRDADLGSFGGGVGFHMVIVALDDDYIAECGG